MSEVDNSKRYQKLVRRSLVLISLAFLFGIVAYNYFKCSNDNQIKEGVKISDDTVAAYKETQKALSLLSIHLNTGVESMQYIREYDSTKNVIFKDK